MGKLSRYDSQKGNLGPSDMQWLEDGVNYLGAWVGDILSFGRKTKKSRKGKSSANKGYLTRGAKNGKLHLPRGKRKTIRYREREREIEIFIED